MILDSLVLANLGLTGVVTLVALYAGYHALDTARRWNPGSASEEQLALEKRTALVTAAARLVLVGAVVGAALFLVTANSLATRITGAMCAYGALAASPYGFPALLLKAGPLFAYGSWLALDRTDAATKGQPHLVTKYRLFTALVPLLIADAAVTAAYFLGLDPQVVVSCCSSTLSSASGFGQVYAEIVHPLLIFLLFLALLAALPVLRRRDRPVAFSGAALAAFATGLGTLVLLVAPHVYDAPHYCPFDLLLPQHGYVGYPLLAALFGGGVHGAAPGVIHVLTRGDPDAAPHQARYGRRATLLLGLFGIGAAVVVLNYYLARGTLIA